MKTIKKIFVLFFIILSLQSAFPQGAVPPPPPGGADGSENTEDNQTHGAPIGGGTFLLIAMGAAYGTKKYFNARKKNEKEIND